MRNNLPNQIPKDFAPVYPVYHTYTPVEDEYFLPIDDYMMPGIRPLYLVSNYSNMYTLRYNRLMKRTVCPTSGYYVVTVQLYGGRHAHVSPHRMAMLAFKWEPGCESLYVDHVDCNKLHCHISNMEWVTLAENTKRAKENGLLLTGENAPWTKVTDLQCHQICQPYVQGYGLSEIKRIVNCGMDSVFRVIHGIGRRDISSQYDIESRYRGFLSDEIIHYICSLFQQYKGMSYTDIKRIIVDTIPIDMTKRHIDSIIRNLYRHDPYCYYNISSQYNY